MSTEETNESESKNERNLESPTERFQYALLFLKTPVEFRKPHARRNRRR